MQTCRHAHGTFDTFQAIHDTLPYLSPEEENTVPAKNEMQNSALFSPFVELLG